MATDMLYKHILNGVKDGVYFVDADRRITFWNQSAEEITGFASKELLNKHCYDNILNHVDDDGKELCHQGCPLHQTLQDGIIRESSIYLHHKDGHRVPVSVHIMPIFDGDVIIGAVETFTDDSARTEFLSNLNELKILAYQDQLTELPNRRYLDTALENNLKTYETLGIPFGVALLDIDKFKDFNDTYGHDVGDEVLQMVSKVFKALIRKDDVIGRWGGEEFVGIFPGVNEEQLIEILNRIRMLIEKSGLRHGDKTLQVTISIGGTIYQPKDSAETIIKRADTLLYKSKDNGRNQVTVK